jgi:pyroglutamyl-peptidase
VNDTVLLTGFEPFDGADTNPSWLAVREIAETWSGSAALRTAELPVEFGTAGDRLLELIARYEPTIVIATGLAEGREAVTVERVAINVADARIADNAGARPIDEPIVPGGPAAHFSSLPIKAIAAALRDDGVPAGVSQTAGTFVCNDVFYRLMHATNGRSMRAGFIHVPAAAEHAAASATALPLATIVRGVRLAVETTVTTSRDLSRSEGAIS